MFWCFIEEATLADWGEVVNCRSDFSLIFVMSGLGRTAASVVDRQQVSFFCLSKRKVPKKKTPEDLLGFTIPMPCASKEKQALRELARCSALNRAQTNACYDPVLVLMLGCV